MHIFLINLDKNADRLAHMTAMLGRLGLPFERVRGVLGAELSQAERSQHFDAIRSLLANRSEMTDGEIGCALSHVSAYGQMIERNLPLALILEDDVELSPQFVKALDFASARLDPTKPQVVLFTYNREPWNPDAESVTAEAEFRFQSFQSMACTDAYVITRPAAELIRRVNYPVIVCADQFRRWRQHFGLELFRVLPATACQLRAKFRSEIPGRVGEIKGLKRLWYIMQDRYLIWRDGK